MSHESKEITNLYGPENKTLDYQTDAPPPAYTTEDKNKGITTFGVYGNNVTNPVRRGGFFTSTGMLNKSNTWMSSPARDQRNLILMENMWNNGEDLGSLPCKHYKPPDDEIKTWMFDGFREWCPYCNQLTNGENLIRSGSKLSGLAAWKAKDHKEKSTWNRRADYDESSTSDLEMDNVNDTYDDPLIKPMDVDNMPYVNLKKVEISQKKGNLNADTYDETTRMPYVNLKSVETIGLEEKPAIAIPNDSFNHPRKTNQQHPNPLKYRNIM